MTSFSLVKETFLLIHFWIFGFEEDSLGKFEHFWQVKVFE